MVLTTQAYVPLLDVNSWLGQRSATFRFELMNRATGFHKGDIYPDRDSPPTLTHDTSRTIKRQLSPLVLHGDQVSLVDPVADRVRVSMLVGDNSYPLGQYVFTDKTIIDTTYGNTLNATLLDEMFIVDQEIERGFSAESGSFINVQIESIHSMITRLVADLPVSVEIAPTPYWSLSGWTIGTTRGQILDTLTVEGDYFPAWFANSGVLRVIRTFDPATEITSFNYDEYDVVIRDSIARTDDLLSAPNRFIVVSNASASTNTPVVGMYDIPESAPHSRSNRGFTLPKVFSLPVDTNAQASAMARNLAIRQLIFERVELTTLPDPRHDSYDIIRWQGNNWLELSWSLPLTEGGEMRHVLRRTYAE